MTRKRSPYRARALGLHPAIAACADALHQARRAIAAYAEVKDAEHERRARRAKKSP